MALKDIVTSAYSNWMAASGPENDIVISSRIRVARNLSNFAFPHLLPADKAGEIIHAVALALKNKELQSLSGGLEVSRMNELSSVERQILVEKHLISVDLMQDYEKKAVALRGDEVLNIMINEEDHLRIQCILPGLQLEAAWEQVDKLDDGLEKTLDYAFSENLGYLTACPTNVGTGLRASVMVHLPGLVHTDQIKSVLATVSKLGIAVRGLYGEGTEAAGNLFQISNQVTLGHSETEIIQNIVLVTKQLLEKERAARKALHDKRREQLEDKIGRSYGILRHARMLSSDECMKRFSDVRLGIDLNIITGIKPQLITELMVLTRTAFLIKKAGSNLSAFDRDVKRAELVREKLAG